MRRRRLIWQIYPTYLLITLISLAAAAIYFVRTFRNFYERQSREHLMALTRLVTDPVERQLAQGVRSELLGISLGRWEDLAGLRLLVLDEEGRLLAQSSSAGQGAGPAALRDTGALETARRKAFEGRDAFHEDGAAANLYLYVPLHVDGRVVAVLRSERDLDDLRGPLVRLYQRVILSGLVIAGLAALLSLAVSRHISQPLEQLRRGAERFARGDLSASILVDQCEEIDGLARAMNHMAVELDEKLQYVTRSRNEQESILASMTEGVLAVDSEEILITMNEAAGRMLALRRERAEGHPVREVVRDPDLQRFVERVLSSGERQECELRIEGRGQMLLRAQGNVLHEPGNSEAIGALVVLQDVTQLRRLENMRRDFVANVSHELRTPITSINGFATTLLEGAMDNPEDARRFLGIIVRQSGRLNNLIEDLLSLSRIQQAERIDQPGGIETELQPIRPVLDAAVQSCLMESSAKDIRVETECAEDLRVRISPPLIEESVLNLLNNAIKYSEPGGVVELSAREEASRMRVSVRDHGIGIAPEHHERIFERFYRVDKARSRKLGGTGLGLAIVKHIAQTHGGSVEVESVPGQGSCFSILLPVAPRAGSGSGANA